MTLRVLILAGQDDVRQALHTALESSGCVIVGDCAAGPEAVALAQSTAPDVVILDGMTADKADLELIRRVRLAVPSARIFVRSSAPAAEVTMEAGADDCVDTSDDVGLVDTLARAAGHEWAASGGSESDDAQPSRRSTRYRVLVVDDDPTARRLLHLSLELEGAEVMEVASLSEARESLGEHFDGFVLDRQLPDGDGLDLLPLLAKQFPQASVVVCSSLNDHAEPWFVVHVPKTDMEGVVSALGLGPGSHPNVPAETRLPVPLTDIVRRWTCSLGRRLSDPSKPVQGLISKLVDALMAAEQATGADTRGRSELTVHQLVDLRDQLTGELYLQLRGEGRGRVLAGVNRELDAWILAVVERDAERRRHQASTDPLTGLPNRRTFHEALTREVARASRNRRALSVVMVDIDDLKAINDREGHLAGDAALVAMADASRALLRAGDSAYRVGGDEFVLLLPETPKRFVSRVIERLQAGGAPGFSWGAATYLEDTEDQDSVIDLADGQLLAQRQRSRA